MKNKTTAAVLAFLLGGLGVHKFYLGKTGQGILYLIFFWTFIPAIIAFIEFIMLLVMSDQDFNMKYNGGSLNYSSGINTADEIEKLGNLREKGLISETEFQNRKRKLL